MKFNAKVSILLISTALLPATILMAISLHQYSQQLREANLKSIHHNVTQAANAISKELTIALHEIELYSQLPELKSMHPIQFLPLLISELDRYEGRYEKFVVGTKAGHVFTTSGGNPNYNWLQTRNDDAPETTPLSIRQRDYWQDTVGNNHHSFVSTVSNPMISYTTGVKQIIIASSIVEKNNMVAENNMFEENNIVVGMIGASIHWERIEQVINKVKQRFFADLDWQVKLFVTSGSGIFWYHWNPDKVVHLKRDAAGKLALNQDQQTISISYSMADEPNPVYQQQFSVMQKGQSGIGSFIDSQDNIAKMLIHAPIEIAGYNLGIEVNSKDLTRPVEYLIRLYTLFFFLVILVILVLALVLSRQLTKPLNHLMLTARAYAQGNYGVKFEVRGHDELATLGDTFNEMAEAIAAREAELKESEQRFDLAMKGANDGLWDWNINEETVYYSPRWKEMLGFDDDDIANELSTFYKLIHPDDKTQIKRALNSITVGESLHYQEKFRMRCKDDSYKHILSRAFPVVDQQGNTVRLVGTHVNITEQVHLENTIRKSNKELEQRVEERTQTLRQANQELERISLLDGLLNIGNRRAMERDLDIISTVSTRYQHHYAMALIDIDWFKQFNDKYGHLEGDVALQLVADTVSESLRDSDRLYRYGGEELLMLMPNTDQEKAMFCAERARKAIEELNLPHQESPKTKLTISIGVASSDSLDWQKLLKLADLALYDAKESGRNYTMAASA